MQINVKTISIIGIVAGVIGILGYFIGSRGNKKPKSNKAVVKKHLKINDTFDRSIRTRLDITPIKNDTDIGCSEFALGEEQHLPKENISETSDDSTRQKEKVKEYLKNIKQSDSRPNTDEEYIKVMQIYAKLSRKTAY